MAYLHRRKIMHREIKTSNLLRKHVKIVMGIDDVKFWLTKMVLLIAFDLKYFFQIPPAPRQRIASVWRWPTPLRCSSQWSKVRYPLYFPFWVIFVHTFFSGTILHREVLLAVLRDPSGIFLKLVRKTWLSGTCVHVGLSFLCIALCRDHHFYPIGGWQLSLGEPV